MECRRSHHHHHGQRVGKKTAKSGGLKMKVPMEIAKASKEPWGSGNPKHPNLKDTEMKWVEMTKSQHEAGTLIQEKPQTEELKEHVQDAAKTRIEF